jgi:hypothetical protein
VQQQLKHGQPIDLLLSCNQSSSVAMPSLVRTPELSCLHLSCGVWSLALGCCFLDRLSRPFHTPPHC